MLEQQFTEAMIKAGMTPPNYILADGELHRFSNEKNQKSEKNCCWYVLHSDDPPSGAFGCWRSGAKEKFTSKTQDKKTTDAERKERATKVEIQQKERQEEKRMSQDVAALKAARMFKNASIALNSKYLIDKGLNGAFYLTTIDSCIKQNTKNRKLYIRVENIEGALSTLQMILEDGSKTFLAGGAISGCFARIGELNEKIKKIVICEGVATAISIHEATGFSVVAALTAQNLLAVAEALRKKFPNLFFIFCADDDSRKNPLNNTGKIKADEARNKFGGVVVMPDFDDDPEDRGLTDFNDMHRLYGAKRVKETIYWALKNNTKT